ncbi:hypothetical protein SAMN05444161_6776 [Rhizobiales bacterium GAS191]|nr:hypothetical protein SAMN05444161_6776 [Rhizobiales bacterium GAS191]
MSWAWRFRPNHPEGEADRNPADDLVGIYPLAASFTSWTAMRCIHIVGSGVEQAAAPRVALGAAREGEAIMQTVGAVLPELESWLARSARLAPSAQSAQRGRLGGVRDNPMPRRDRHRVGADLQVVVRTESELIKPQVTLQPHTDSAREGLSRAPEWGASGFSVLRPARPLRPSLNRSGPPFRPRALRRPLQPHLRGRLVVAQALIDHLRRAGAGHACFGSRP